jgi:putative transposase
MANTYTQVNIQCVFAVKGRQNLLASSFRDELFQYMSAVLKSHHAYPLAVGGWTDHVHVFFEMPTDRSISDLMRDVKAISSKWINENKFVPGRFQWQSGYGAFSYSKSQRDNVIRYIMRQEEHHKRQTFKNENLELLKRLDVPYNPNYLFEFYDEVL